LLKGPVQKPTKIDFEVDGSNLTVKEIYDGNNSKMREKPSKSTGVFVDLQNKRCYARD